MKISSIFQQTFLYATSIALMRGISLLMLPFIAKYLSPEEFGEVELLSTIAVLGSVMVGLGLEDALYRFVGKEKTNEKRCQVAALIFTVALLIGVLFSLCVFPIIFYLEHQFSFPLSSLSIKLVFAILALEGIIAIPLGWLRICDRAITFCVFNVTRVIVQSVLTIYLLTHNYGVDSVFIAGFIAALLQGIGLSIIQIQHTKLYFNKILTMKIIVYSLPLVGSGILAFGLNGFDRWIILDKLSISDVAIYGIAAKFSIGLTILMQPFGMWWMPRRFIVLNESNGHHRVLRSSLTGLILLILLMFFIGSIAPWVIQVIMPHSYMSSGIYLVGILVVVALKEACELINIGCFIDKSTQKQLWINIGATIIGCFGMVLLTPSFKLWGVICALGLAQAFRLHAFYYFSQQRIPLAYPLKQLYLLFILAVINLILCLEISNMIQIDSITTKYSIFAYYLSTFVATTSLMCLCIYRFYCQHIRIEKQDRSFTLAYK